MMAGIGIRRRLRKRTISRAGTARRWYGGFVDGGDLAMAGRRRGIDGWRYGDTEQENDGESLRVKGYNGAEGAG